MKFTLLPLLLAYGIAVSIATTKNVENPNIRNIEHVTIGGLAKYHGFDVPVDYKVGAQTVVVITMCNTGMYNTTASDVFEKIYEMDAKWSELNEKIAGVDARMNKFEVQIQNIVQKQNSFVSTISNLQQGVDRCTTEIHEQKGTLQLLSRKITSCEKCKETYEENSKIKSQIEQIQTDFFSTKNNLQTQTGFLKTEMDNLRLHVDKVNTAHNATIIKLREEILEPASDGSNTSTTKRIRNPSTTEKIRHPSTTERIRHPSTTERIRHPSTTERIRHPSTTERIRHPSTSEKIRHPSTTERIRHPSTTAINPYRTNKGKLLQYFLQPSSSKIISGVCFDEGEEDFDAVTEAIKTKTGVFPGMLTIQMPTIDDSDSRKCFVTEAIKLWNCGHLLSIFWWDSPLTTIGKLTELQWADLTRENGRLNQEWKIHLDSLVSYLRQLQDAGITLIIDPLPRLNSRRPRWGGRSGVNGSLKLYQLTHDYLTKIRGFTSFLWVWSLDGEEDMTRLRKFWPGSNYVDVISVYMYNETNLDSEVYQNLLNIGGNKPISMESMSSIPSEQVLALQPKLSWFTLSSDYVYTVDNQILKSAFLNPSVVNNGNLSFFDN